MFKQRLFRLVSHRGQSCFHRSPLQQTFSLHQQQQPVRTYASSVKRKPVRSIKKSKVPHDTTDNIEEVQAYEGQMKWVTLSYQHQEPKNVTTPAVEEDGQGSGDEDQSVVANSSSKRKRLDKSLSEQLNLSREYITWLLDNNHVRTGSPDGLPENAKTVLKKTTKVTSIKQGDNVFVFLQQRHVDRSEETNVLDPEQHLQVPPVHVIYEDSDVIVVNKPSGYAVHAAGVANPPHSTMLYAIRKYVQQREDVGKSDLPTFVSLVHRLDKDTSGVLICGKNSRSIQNINQQFLANTSEDVRGKKHTQKVYCAIVTVPFVDKLRAQLRPMRDRLNIEEGGANDDIPDEPFNINDFVVELPTGEKRDLTLSDLELTDSDKVEQDDIEEEERGAEEGDEARRDNSGVIIIEKPITILGSHRTGGILRKSIESERENETPGEAYIREQQLKHSKSARSVVRVMEVNEKKKLALVLVNIKSGRTHQIRSHLASIGTPVLGDYSYYDLIDNRLPWAIERKVNPGVDRIMLHCLQMRFNHPNKQKAVKCFAPVAGNMGDIISRYFSEKVVNQVRKATSSSEEQEHEE